MYKVSDEERARLQKNFTYHPPKPDQLPRYEEIRLRAKECTVVILACCPPSRERSLAMTALEESVMWANASIARNEA